MLSRYSDVLAAAQSKMCFVILRGNDEHLARGEKRAVNLEVKATPTSGHSDQGRQQKTPFMYILKEGT